MEPTPVNQRIRIQLKAYDVRVIDESARHIIETALRSHATVTGPVPLPTAIQRTTVLRSPHIYKDAREAFEMRTHKRLIDITDYRSETVDALMSLQLPNGVDIAIKM